MHRQAQDLHFSRLPVFFSGPLNSTFFKKDRMKNLFTVACKKIIQLFLDVSRCTVCHLRCVSRVASALNIVNTFMWLSAVSFSCGLGKSWSPVLVYPPTGHARGRAPGNKIFDPCFQKMCRFGGVTKANSLCFGGWQAARWGKQLEKNWKSLYCSRVSEDTSGSLGTSFATFWEQN